MKPNSPLMSKINNKDLRPSTYTEDQSVSEIKGRRLVAYNDGLKKMMESMSVAEFLEKGGKIRKFDNLNNEI